MDSVHRAQGKDSLELRRREPRPVVSFEASQKVHSQNGLLTDQQGKPSWDSQRYERPNKPASWHF